MATSPMPVAFELTLYIVTEFQQIIKAFLGGGCHRGGPVKPSFRGWKLIWDPCGTMWLVSRLCVCGGGEVVGAEGRGLVCRSAVRPCAVEESGAKDFLLGRDQRTQSVLPGRFLSRPTPASLPSFHPTPSTVPTGGRLYLPSVDAILECGTCQWTGPWSWAPPPAGRLRVWEAGAGPGKTCHQSCLSNSLLQWRREGCRVTADG